MPLKIISIFVAILIGYDEISTNISNIANTIGLPLSLIIKLVALILIVYWALYILHKIFKKTKHNNSPQIALQINNEETREAANKFRKTFIDILLKIKHEQIPYPKKLSGVVSDLFPETQKAVDKFLSYLNTDDKEKVSKAYYKFRFIDSKYQPERYERQSSIIYDSTEKEMIEDGLNTPEIKTGKDLLLHNLQQIIDLIK